MFNRLIDIGMAALIGLAALTYGAPGWAEVTVVESERTLVEIDVRKGRLLRLPRAAAAVFVAEPEIAGVTIKSPTLVYVTGKRTGETTLFAVDEQDNVLADVRLRTTHNLTGLGEALGALFPGTNIAARSIARGLLLTGRVMWARQAAEAARIATEFVAEDERIINRIEVIGPNQINLRVRVAEVSRDVMKRFGINFDVIPNIGSFAFGIATGNPVAVAGAFATRTEDVDNIFGGVTTGSLDANAVIDALAAENIITLLAEPNLTAMSGETASFLAGGEFPIPVPQGDGDITIEFKKFGVSLAFTPTILDSGRISLKVLPEVSALTTTGGVQIQGFTIPALTMRRADTTVELASGQSLAIAGLLRNDTDQLVDEFPGLADLPILGALFRSTEFSRNESELVIIATPYLVRPVGAALAMAAPTDGFRLPDDFDRIVNGKLYRDGGVAGDLSQPGGGGARLVGPGGFVLN